MAKLDTYTTPLTSKTAAHLLRRATFGPTKAEVNGLVGKSAIQALDFLIGNASYRKDVPGPVEMEEGRADSGQPFLHKPFTNSRNFQYTTYIQYWWIGLMTEQNGRPSVLEKLTAFWQNHFVIKQSAVEDYRYIDKHIRFLRNNALGNFRNLVTGITKDPAMLVFQDGYKNEKKQPNENYGRELQELFTVGQQDFRGNPNYTEPDIKAAARVLTGWQVTNLKITGSTAIESKFTPERHDITDKVFSSKYNNKVIAGRSGDSAGEDELNDLVDMLLSHPETPKFICRKLYRWYVNANVTDEIEDEVIIPLATFFASTENNYAIMPVLKKLLTSNIFYEQQNVGSLIKSPAEFIIGMLRFFEQPVPDYVTEYSGFRNMMNFIKSGMSLMQLDFLDQPTVFGSLPYYQTGYTRNWINGTTLGLRYARIDALINPSVTIRPAYLLGIDILSRLTAIQPNFSNPAGSPAISCEQVLAEFSDNLFAFELTQIQKDFLIDNIMMMNSSPRTTWIREWDAYRASPNDVAKQGTILWRCKALLRYMLRMAEFQVF